MGEEKEMTETQNASTETFAHRQTAPVAPPLLSAQEALVALVNHAVAASLIDEQDVTWATNQIAHLIGFEEAPALDEASLEKIELPEDDYSTLPEGYTLQGILDILTKAAVENGVIEQGVSRPTFSTQKSRASSRFRLPKFSRSSASSTCKAPAMQLIGSSSFAKTSTMCARTD